MQSFCQLYLLLDVVPSHKASRGFFSYFDTPATNFQNISCRNFLDLLPLSQQQVEHVDDVRASMRIAATE